MARLLLRRVDPRGRYRYALTNRMPLPAPRRGNTGSPKLSNNPGAAESYRDHRPPRPSHRRQGLLGIGGVFYSGVLLLNR